MCIWLLWTTTVSVFVLDSFVKIIHFGNETHTVTPKLDLNL